MQITGPVPDLSRRAKEQLTSLGFDVAIGYQRLRAIGASRRRIQAEGHMQRDQLKGVATSIDAALRRGADEHSIAMKELRAAHAAGSSKLAEVDTRLATLRHEEAAVKAWHSPCSRTLSLVLEALGGFNSLNQVLPDFDTGEGVDLDAYREVVASEVYGARAFGGQR